MDAFLGVDVSSGQWAGVLLGDRRDTCFVADRIEALIAEALAEQRPLTVAIDIPINPPISGVRSADRAARAVLGSRGSTLFNTPSLAAVEAEHFEEAVEANVRQQGVGLSKQSWGLVPWIRDVRDWVAKDPAGVTVLECHPEVSFAHMMNPRNPTAVQFRKKSWEGMRRRIRMLHGAGIDVQYIRDESGQIGADDLIDAAAAAWTARRFAAGIAVRYPAVDAEGDEATIWA